MTASPELVELARRHDIAPALEARRVPAAVFRLPRDLLARFLNRALGGAAALWRPMHGEPGRLVVGTRSQGLVHDLQHLLLRFGVASRVTQSVVAVDQTTWLAHDLVVDEPAPHGAGRPHRPAGPRGRAGRGGGPRPDGQASHRGPAHPRPSTGAPPDPVAARRGPWPTSLAVRCDRTCVRASAGRG